MSSYRALARVACHRGLATAATLPWAFVDLLDHFLEGSSTWNSMIEVLGMGTGTEISGR